MHNQNHFEHIERLRLRNDGADPRKPLCHYCNGFGFTWLITGGSKTCIYCLGSGIDEKKVAEVRFATIESRLDEILRRLK